jgi:hypothetical protein
VAKRPNMQNTPAAPESAVYNSRMKPKFTRREWAVILGSVAVPAAPFPSRAEAQATDSLSAEARAEVASDLRQVSSYPLPQAIEPAFLFKP